MAATTEEVPRPYGRGTYSVVSFVVAMNRVDVVDLVVDLVDVDLGDVVSLSPGSFLISGLLAPGCIFAFWPRAVFLPFGPRLFRQYFSPAVFGASLYSTLDLAPSTLAPLPPSPTLNPLPIPSSTGTSTQTRSKVNGSSSQND